MIIPQAEGICSEDIKMGFLRSVRSTFTFQDFYGGLPGVVGALPVSFKAYLCISLKLINVSLESFFKVQDLDKTLV